jgi:hypothetical protein
MLYVKNYSTIVPTLKEINFGNQRLAVSFRLFEITSIKALRNYLVTLFVLHNKQEVWSKAISL